MLNKLDNEIIQKTYVAILSNLNMLLRHYYLHLLNYQIYLYYIKSPNILQKVERNYSLNLYLYILYHCKISLSIFYAILSKCFSLSFSYSAAIFLFNKYMFWFYSFSFIFLFVLYQKERFALFYYVISMVFYAIQIRGRFLNFAKNLLSLSSLYVSKAYFMMLFINSTGFDKSNSRLLSMNH